MHTIIRIIRIIRPLTLFLLLIALLPLSTYAADPLKKEFRGVWVSSVYNLDYPSAPTTDSVTLKLEADDILRTCKELGMTAVFLQVRPSCDALYPSTLFPWSKYLTGVNGTAPTNGFDPLQYWVEQAHALGLELHAWINPFRITKGGPAELAALPPSSPAVLHPDWVVEYEADKQKNYYLNPGIPEVRELVIQGAEELVHKYDIDGIHLDDYFYPGSGFADATAFARDNRGFSDLADWRRDNVNLLIQTLDKRLHGIDPELSFGVSPSGVWRDQRNDSLGSPSTGGFESWSYAYADSRKWVKEGWVDYICPQIYWPIGHKSMDYKGIAEWWCRVVEGTDVQLYIGMADYQADSTKESSAWYGLTALRNQLTLNRSLSQITGEVHFRYKFLSVNANMAGLYRVWHFVDDPVAVSAFLSTLPVSEARHWAAPSFGTLGATGIVSGYPDGSYRPDGKVTRAEMAKLVYTALPALRGNTDVSPFPDATGHWSAPYLSALYQAGYLAEYSNGFGPDEPMPRAEVVRLLIRALGSEIPAELNSRFPDVTEADGPVYIEVAAALGLVKGRPDGSFGPKDPVTRGEAAALMVRAGFSA